MIGLRRDGKKERWKGIERYEGRRGDSGKVEGTRKGWDRRVGRSERGAVGGRGVICQNCIKRCQPR